MTQFRAAKALSPTHPDRLCSLIADKVLDDCLAHDPTARVDCRVQLAQKELLIFGEIVSLHMPKVQESAAAVLAEVGLCPADYSVATALHQRAPGIEMQGASCVVSGYACDETPELLPLPAVLADRLSREMHSAGEAMVVVEYDEDGRPLRVDQISIAAQQDDRFVHNTPRLVEQTLQGFSYDEDSKLSLTILPLEPQFQVAVNDPMSGKSPDNLEWSAALMARYVAKNIVAAKLARQCQVTLAYAVGANAPAMVTVDSFGTGEVCADDCLAEAAKMVFELEKQKLTSWIKLSRPNYLDISLGRYSGPWERTDKVTALWNAVL